MSCPPNGHERGVSGPYFLAAHVLVEVMVLQASKVVMLGAPPFVQELTVCMSRRTHSARVSSVYPRHPDMQAPSQKNGLLSVPLRLTESE